MKKKKVLFVDDDPDTLEIVSVILEGEEVELVPLTEMPAEVVIADAGPDLILLDEWLPGKTGSEYCRELKSKKHTAHIPVILISAVADLENVARNCQADGFILNLSISNN
jgi:response regulator RpfG family c-di-GMP phosphodiesterase